VKLFLQILVVAVVLVLAGCASNTPQASGQARIVIERPENMGFLNIVPCSIVLDGHDPMILSVATVRVRLFSRALTQYLSIHATRMTRILPSEHGLPRLSIFAFTPARLWRL
jgi:hypothetical protein